MKYLFLLFSVSILFISCSPNVAKIDNSLQKYFDSANVTGSFAFLNNQMGDITVYNMPLDTLRMSPGNSFKIAETLIGVESSRLIDEKTIIRNSGNTLLDSVTLKEAFDNNNTSYFSALAQKIGKDTMATWMDSLKYGNMKIEPLDSFWINGALKVSPDEQMGMLYKIYFDKLPFQKYAQQVVRDLMLKEDNTLFKLSYATSPALSNKNEPMAWLGGWIEENLHVYFFVCVVQSKDVNKDLEATALQITKNILAAKGFFKGKK